MSTAVSDQLINGYLERLNACSLRLPPDRRAELLEEISEHIASARAAGAAADEAAVRTLLDRLGEPEEIVASAADDTASPTWPSAPPPPAGPPPPQRDGTVLEIIAIIFMTAGSVIPVAGWLAGIVMMWVSQRWRWWEKLLGTLVFPFGPGILLVASLFALPIAGPTESCSSGPYPVIGPHGHGIVRDHVTTCTTSGPPTWLGPAIFAAYFVLPIALDIWLLYRARTHARAEVAMAG